MFQAAFRHQTAIRVRCSRPRFVVPPVGHGAHHRRIVKADCLLDQGEALFGFLHLGHVLGVVLWRLAGHRETDASVVGADAVADLSAQQFIYRHSGYLPCDVPESDLDRAHRRTPGLERTEPADLQHHPLDVRRIFAEKIVLIKEHHRLEIRLGGLGLTVPGDALIGDDSNDRVPADDCAPEVRDLDGCHARSAFPGSTHCPLLSRERRCGRHPRERSDKSSSRPISHACRFCRPPVFLDYSVTNSSQRDRAALVKSVPRVAGTETNPLWNCPLADERPRRCRERF